MSAATAIRLPHGFRIRTSFQTVRGSQECWSEAHRRFGLLAQGTTRPVRWSATGTHGRAITAPVVLCGWEREQLQTVLPGEGLRPIDDRPSLRGPAILIFQLGANLHGLRLGHVPSGDARFLIDLLTRTPGLGETLVSTRACALWQSHVPDPEVLARGLRAVVDRLDRSCLVAYDLTTGSCRTLRDELDSAANPAVADSLHSFPIGLVSHAHRARSHNGTWYAVAEAGGLQQHLEHRSGRAIGFGCGSTSRLAIVRAYYETLERACGLIYAVDHRCRRPRELGDDAFHPSTLSLIPDERLASLDAYQPADEIALDWCWYEDLNSGRPRLVTAQQTYLDYAENRGEPRIDYALSTGMAVGPSRECAIDAALIELVERDAIARNWPDKLLRVPPDVASGLVAERDEQGAAFWIAPNPYGVFVVLCAIVREDTSQHVHTAWGAGASRSLTKALGKALDEACMIRRGLSARSGVDMTICAPASVRRARDHAAFYGNGSGSTAVAHALSLRAATAQEMTVDTLDRAGMHAAMVARHGAILVRDLGGSLAALHRAHCVRAAVPGMRNVSFDHAAYRGTGPIPRWPEPLA